MNWKRINALTGSIAAMTMLGTTTALAQDAADDIAFKPEKLSIGGMGSNCRTGRIRATNNTGEAIDNPTFTISESGKFSIDKSFQKCPDPLPPGESCRVYVRFCPRAQGSRQATLKFSASNREIPVVGYTTQRHR